MTAVPAVVVAALVAATAPWQARAARHATGTLPPKPAGALIFGLTAGLVTLSLALRLPLSGLVSALPLAVAGPPLAVLDVRCHRLPDRLTGRTLLAVAGALVVTAVVTDAPVRLGGAVVGAAGMAGFYALVLAVTAAVDSSAAYGLGDIKLALPLGAALGWLGLIPWFAALLGAHLLYLGVHVTRALAGRTGWHDRHAFGPPMLGAALIAAVLVGAA